MDRKPYTSLSEAYMKMFEAPEKPGKPPMGMPVPTPYMPLRPVNIHRTNVEIDVTQPYVGPGGVEKAYYTYPAGFDPTNREDVIKDSDYDGSKARPEAAKMTKEDIEIVGDYLMEAGLVSSADDVDAFFTHMSDEWKSHVITTITEKADDNGNTKCWDTHKKVGMKKKGGKMVNNCVPK